MEKSKPNKAISLAFYFITYGHVIRKIIIFSLISSIIIYGAVKLLG